MVSVLAAGCSVYFNQRLPSYIPEKADIGPVFDCRVWNVPNLDEGANAFLWREYDATKNSISMAARAYYEHSEIDNKSGSEMQEMLFAKGVNWNDYPTFFKRGTYVRRRIVRTAFTAKELASLPEKHHAHKNPDAEFLRNVISTFDLPPLTKVVNRSAVLFQGAEPELAT
jgi:tRNA(His) guanylyltransferase